jgi:hypothetical protein
MSRIALILSLAKHLLSGELSKEFIELLHSPLVDTIVKATPNAIDEKVVAILRMLFPKEGKVDDKVM